MFLEVKTETGTKEQPARQNMPAAHSWAQLDTSCWAPASIQLQYRYCITSACSSSEVREGINDSTKIQILV